MFIFIGKLKRNISNTRTRQSRIWLTVVNIIAVIYCNALGHNVVSFFFLYVLFFGFNGYGERELREKKIFFLTYFHKKYYATTDNRRDNREK